MDEGCAAQDGGAASAEAPDAAGVYRIWPGSGAAPGSEDWDWQERTAQIPWSERPRRYTRNVVVPTVTLFRPEAGRANGTSLVIAPGGAFHFLMVDYEGYDMARWAAALGFTALVLKYRVMRTPDADDEVLGFRNALQQRLGRPEQDAAMRAVRLMGEEDGRQALRFVRAHAAEWGLDPARIGIAGFSAGGAVALGAAMQHDAESRPDFVAGIYAPYCAELAPAADAPPLFLAIADDDASVAPASAVRLYERWHAAGAAAELHVFANGAHGFGMAKDGFTADSWTQLFENWLRAHGLLE